MIRTKILALTLFLFILSTSALAEHNANITDYNTTVSGAKETRINFEYNKTTNIDNFEKLTTDYSTHGKLTLLHNNFYDSYNTGWNYSLQAEQEENGDLTTAPQDTYTHDYDLSGNYSVYFIPEQNIYHGLGARYTTGNDWDSDGPNTDTSSTSYYYMIGMGHVIDVTSMAEAGNLEDRLMEVKALKSRLSKAELLKLAEIIRKWRMNEYTYKNQDTGKGKFLEDITKVLDASGKLNGTLDGFSFWRISDSRTVNYNRYKGWEVGAQTGTTNIITTNYNAQSYASSTNNYGELFFSYFWPIDWRSQIEFETSYQKAFNPNDTYMTEGSASMLIYTYDLTNYLWARVTGMLSRNNYTSMALSDASTQSFRAFVGELNYKVEDHWYLTLAYSKQYYDTWNMREVIMFSNGFWW